MPILPASIQVSASHHSECLFIALYLVLGNKLQGGEIGHPPLLQGQPMQDGGYGLERIFIPHTPVNKHKKKGRGALLPALRS